MSQKPRHSGTASASATMRRVSGKRQPNAAQVQAVRYIRYPPGRRQQGGKRQAQHTKRGLALASVPQGAWVLGGNDLMPTCVVTAIANSLLVQAGIRASEHDIRRLHELAGGDDSGVVIADALDALLAHGLCGMRCDGVITGDPALGMVAGDGNHALFARHDSVVTWGQRVSCEPGEWDESWTIRWA